MKEITGLILLYIASIYIAYKIFQPEIEQTMIKLKILKKPLHRKIRKTNTNKKI